MLTPATPCPSLKESICKVKSWTFDVALPFWSTVGFDFEKGVSRERLDLTGQVEDPGFRRTRAMARQVYVFSHAEMIGWDGPAAEIADRTLAFMIKNCWRGSEHGWVRQIDDKSDGILDDTPDLYDLAFALFALSWRFKVTGRTEHRDLALETLAFICNQMRSPDGLGFLECKPAGLLREQNPHMHLLEALIVLASCCDEPVVMVEAEKILSLYEQKIIDPTTGALREVFGPGWAYLETPEGRITEPGHQFEWVWILHQFETVGRKTQGRVIERLYNFAERHGICSKTGLTFDQVGVDGQILKRSCRSWPQTETLKALVAMGEREGYNRERIASVIDNIFKFYLDHSPNGTWMDQLDESLQGVSTFIPSTTLYHIFLAFTEVLRVESSIMAEC